VYSSAGAPKSCSNGDTCGRGPPGSLLDVFAQPELMVRTGGFLPFFDFFDFFGLRPRDTGDM
jgi:hypothetical protein